MTQNETIDHAYLMARNFKTIYLTIAVQVADTADCQEVVEDLEIIEHQVEDI